MSCRTTVVSTLLIFWFFVTAVAAQKPTSGAAPVPINVLTYHNDNGRTGLMQQETTLTLANVNSATFGKLNFLTADGKVDAEPLYASNVVINGIVHNVLYVVSENDSIYAFDGSNCHQIASNTQLIPSDELPADCTKVGGGG